MLYVQRPKKGHGNLSLKLATVFFSRRPTNGFVIVGSCSIRVSDLCPQHQQMPSIERMFTYLFKNGPFPASFLCVFVFSTVNSLTVIIFADGWIRTEDVCYRKQPNCRLSHDHFPNLPFFVRESPPV